jgi:hypothetical protein
MPTKAHSNAWDSSLIKLNCYYAALSLLLTVLHREGWDAQRSASEICPWPEHVIHWLIMGGTWAEPVLSTNTPGKNFMRLLPFRDVGCNRLCLINDINQAPSLRLQIQKWPCDGTCLITTWKMQVFTHKYNHVCRGCCFLGWTAESSHPGMAALRSKWKTASRGTLCIKKTTQITNN